jgi:drug/metabolite transporter (DMT)-like permease
VRARPLLLLVLAAASWGTGTVLSKRAVGELPPMTLLAAQLVVSVAVLAVAVIATREPVRSVQPRLALLGALNPAVAYGLSLFGLTMVTASVSVLVWATEPLLIAALAALVLRERPGWIVAALSVVALGGLVLVLVDPSAPISPPGIALTVLGVACCAVYSVATRAWIGDAPSTLGVVFAQQAVAAGVVVATLPLVGLGALAPSGLSGPGLASVVASGVLYYGAAYLLYLTALRSVPVSIAAIAFYLVPIFGVGAALVSGEGLGGVQWLGATITVAAVLAVGWVQARLPSPAT